MTDQRKFEVWVHDKVNAMEYMVGGRVYEASVLVLYLLLVVVANTYAAARYQFTGDAPHLLP